MWYFWYRWNMPVHVHTVLHWLSDWQVLWRNQLQVLSGVELVVVFVVVVWRKYWWFVVGFAVWRLEFEQQLKLKLKLQHQLEQWRQLVGQLVWWRFDNIFFAIVLWHIGHRRCVPIDGGVVRPPLSAWQVSWRQQHSLLSVGVVVGVSDERARIAAR